MVLDIEIREDSLNYVLSEGLVGTECTLIQILDVHLEGELTGLELLAQFVEHTSINVKWALPEVLLWAD